MASGQEIKANPLVIDLDPENPRFAREQRILSQDEILLRMLEEFNLNEIAESIISIGYFPFDPIICYSKKTQLIVLEGNRRIATLKLLRKPDLALKYEGEWQALSRRLRSSTIGEIQQIPIKKFKSRKDADLAAYIGFRHVTGALKWPAFEKARYIARLIDDLDWSYVSVAQKIGSKRAYVEKHYVAYKLAVQAQDKEIKGAENVISFFGVLLRALQTPGIVKFLGVSYPNNPKKSEHPVPNARLSQLQEFVSWTFGSKDSGPIMSDSRQLSKFGKILMSEEAVQYLLKSRRPSFDIAWLKSGGEEESLEENLSTVKYRLEEVVPNIAKYKENREIHQVVEDCTYYLSQVLLHFPDIRDKYFNQTQHV